MRLLLLAVLALAAVALGATYEPQGGCDYDFGAGNGTAYLVVNNPYNLVLPLNITYQSGEHKYSEVRNILNTRVIVFCGLGHGWLYIQQNASPPGTPLMWYPLAVPRYVVLQAGVSATMLVTTLFAPAVIISIAILLIVAILLRPRLRRSAIYAVPDELRGMDIRELVSILLFFVFTLFFLYTLLVYKWPPSPELIFSNVLTPTLSLFVFSDILTLFVVYVLLTLGSFYLAFRRGVWTYHFLFISFLINTFLTIKVSNSLLLFVLFFIWYITILLTSSVALLSFYNLLMIFFLSTYGIAVFIYYDMNFGYIIPWSLSSLQIPIQVTLHVPVIFPVQVTFNVPVILTVFFPAIVGLGMIFLIVMFWLVYGLTMHARATTPHMVSWPPLWWWFGLGLFAWDELEARRRLHMLSADYTVVVELSRGERAIVVSADLYGVYLCSFGKRGGVCNNVEWVPYDEVEIKASKIINKETRNKHVVNKVALKIVPLILAYILTFFIIKYIGLPTVLIIPLYLAISVLPYVYNCLREKIKKCIKQIINQYKEFKNLKMHIFYVFRALAVSLIFGLLASDFFVFVGVFIATITISFRLIKDPELHSYLYPDLELRLMSVGGLVIGLARGGCLRWTKVGVAPKGHDIVIRDEDCEVVVSPYVEQKESRPQCVLCGPACPPLRIIGGERVVVRVKDGQKEYCYYVADSR